MNRALVLVSSLVALSAQLRAAVPPAEQLLPDDTLGLITFPDWEKASAYLRQSPPGQLWHDPALRQFREHFEKQFKEDVAAPLERELGIKLADYAGLIQGQITFAVTQNGWDGASEKKPALTLLIDTKNKSDQLKGLLALLKKKWVDSGKQIKAEKIRGVEFTTLLLNRDDLGGALKKVFPSAEASPAQPDKTEEGKDVFEITFGQSESLLIAGNSLKVLEKILIRQAGGSVGVLAEQASYEANHSAMFRDALAFGWVHFKPLYEILLRQTTAAGRGPSGANPLGVPPDKALAATGLGGLKTIGFKLGGNNNEGTLAEVFLGVPESDRQGLFKILAMEAKESAPPPFVPADATKFSRWRLNGQKAYATLESMLASIMPELASILQMSLDMAGKEKDPNFDLKKDLIGNLGDDFVIVEKKPRSSSLADLGSPPELILIGSPNAEKLANALKATASILPVTSGDAGLNEREFLGRKVYSMTLPSNPSPDGSKPINRTFNFAASGGYVALSDDVALLEEFLRSAESTGKSLRETEGLAEAAQKTGGLNTGFFAFENQRETWRSSFEALKTSNAQLDRLLSLTEKLGTDQGAENVKEWLDVRLLPPFDKVAKYFHFMVYSGSASANGLSWKAFLPTPPAAR